MRIGSLPRTLGDPTSTGGAGTVDGPAKDAPPVGDDAESGRTQRDWRWAVSIAGPSLVAALPFLVIVVVALANADRPGMSRGDYAFIELSTRAALHGEVVLGPYSRYGWNHPGPALFYWFAPFFGVLGRMTESLGAGAAVLNTVAISGSVLVARLASGRRAAWTVAGASAVMVAVWGYSWIDRIWNPFVVLTLVVLTAFLAAAVMAGVRWMLAPLVGVASFAVQSHVGTAPIIGLMLGASIIGVAVAIGQSWRAWVRPLIATALVTTALWALPVYEQATGHPGNLTQLIDFFRRSRGHHSLRQVLDVVTVQLTLGKVGMISNVVSARRLLPAATARRTTELVVLLLVVAAGLILNRRAGRRFEQHLCAVALLGTVGVVVASMRVTGDLERYLTLPATAVGTILWAAALLSVSAEIAVRTPAGVRPHLRVLGLVGSVAIVVACATWIVGDRPETHLQVPVRPDRQAIATIERIRAVVPAGVQEVLMVPGEGALSASGTLANQLEARGLHTRARPSLDYLFGRSRRSTGCERVAVSVTGRFEPVDPSRGPTLGRIDGTTVQVEPRKPPARCR